MTTTITQQKQATACTTVDILSHSASEQVAMEPAVLISDGGPGTPLIRKSKEINQAKLKLKGIPTVETSGINLGIG